MRSQDRGEAIVRIKRICDESEGRSQFFPFGGSGYKSSVTHYLDSSAEIATCAVHPGSVEDLQAIFSVIAETRLRFAIKCGGHSTNPGFSSTKGVQIYLVRLNKITVHKDKKLVDVEAGCLFSELYRALARHNLNIVGGSGLGGIGVAGWMLGGGYSPKTSRYGLGVDNIESAKIILPDGTFKVVSAAENEDLFFAIKGGGNNFGVVTEFTLKAHEQRNYYEFLLTYKEQHYDAVKLAIANFVEKADNKANLEAAFRHDNTPEGIQWVMTVHCVYDDTFPTNDPFGELRAIEHAIDNYGDPLPVPAGAQPYQAVAFTHTSPFHATAMPRSSDNGTFGLSAFRDNLADNTATEDQNNVVMSGRSCWATECADNGSMRSERAKRPTRPVVGMSELSRGRWGNVMVDTFTPHVIAEIETQSTAAAKDIHTHGGRRVMIGMWPFTTSMFDNATPAAWPHYKGKPNCPIIVYFIWEGEENDAFWVRSMMSTLETLRASVHALRPASRGLPYFINTALAERTTAEQLYRSNLGKLSALRAKYDPKGVMNLTGGFRIPLPVPGQSVVARSDVAERNNREGMVALYKPKAKL